MRKVNDARWYKTLLYQCEDQAKYHPTTCEDAPKKEATESSSIPANSKPANPDDTAVAKTNDSKEMSHVPFVMRTP